MLLQRFKFSPRSAALIAIGLFIAGVFYASARSLYRGYLTHHGHAGVQSSESVGVSEASFAAHGFTISGWASPGAAIDLTDGVESAADTVADKEGKWDLSFSSNGKRIARSLDLMVGEKDKSAAIVGRLKYFVPAAEQNNAFIWWAGEKDKPPFILQSPAGEDGALFLSQLFAGSNHPLWFAGHAAAGNLVQLYADGQLVGRAKADPKGWWFIPSVAGLDKKTAVLRVDGINIQGRLAERRAYHLSWPEDKDEGDGKLAVVNAGDDGWILGEGIGDERELVYLLKPEAGETVAIDKEFPGQLIPAPAPK